MPVTFLFIFKNTFFKVAWLREVDNVNDVRRAVGKYVDYSEVKDLKFVKDAAEDNAEYLARHPGHIPPYKFGEEVKSYLRTTEELNKIGYVRIHAADNQARSWIITKSDFEKLKLEAQSLNRNLADYLKEKLNLTYTPTKVSLFEPPVGEVFAIRESVVNPIDPSAPNQTQYEILEEFIDRTWFKELEDL